MKKIVSSAALVAVLGVSCLADSSDTQNLGLFFGASAGVGTGYVGYSADNDKTYTFTDSSDLSTTDAKLYAGYKNWYGFMQLGTLSPATKFMDDMDYTAFGIGYLSEVERWSFELGPINAVPEFNLGLGYDSVKGKGNDVFEASGLLVLVEGGLAFSLNDFKNLKITTDIGYDLHVVNQSGDNGGSWNFGAFKFNVGARYAF